MTPTSPTGTYREGTLLPNGRLLRPAGSLTPLGDFPTGIATTPDGRYAIVANTGQGSGAPQQGNESLQVVDTSTGAVLQTVTDHEPGRVTFVNSGVAISRDGATVYSAGGGDDQVHVYALRNGRLSLTKRVVTTRRHGTPTVGLGTPVEGVPATAPLLGNVVGYPRELALTPDGATLLVTNEQGGSVAALDASTGAIRWETQLLANQQHAGAYPAGIAVSPDGATAWVTAQGPGALYGLDVTTGAIRSATPVGDHAVGVSLSRDGSWGVVANANDDTVSVVDLKATPATVLARIPVATMPDEALGASPESVRLDEAHGRIYVPLAGDDDVAVLGSGSDHTIDPHQVRLLGHIPTAWWPTAVAVTSRGDLLVTSAKGLGGVPVTDRHQYDANDMVGTLSRVALPSDATLQRDTQDARTGLTWGRRSDSLRPAGSPVPDEAHAGQSPIKHVVLVVRENRTFDQVYGDLPRLGQRGADVDPRYLEFGLKDGQGRTVTPNGHTIATRFGGISDNFYSDGEASIQGHFWTSLGNSTDYGERSWLHYYSDRNHTYDPTSSVVYARCGAEYHNAVRSGRSVRDFGELVGLSTVQAPLPVSEPHDGCSSPGGASDPQVAASTSAAYPNNLELTSVKDTDRITEFKQEYAPLVAADQVPAYSYLLLGNDHTDGTNSGKPTPQAHVATNDLALGQLLEYLSGTPQWSSTAVFVVEDDSQDGLDHRDGHRNVLLAAGPWISHGALSHLHTSQVGVLRTIELILGMPHLSAYTQEAPVPWDLFATKPDLSPYTAITPTYPLTATNGAPAAGTAAAVPVDTRQVDLGGPVLEAQLWQATHPGQPTPEALLAELRARGGVTPQAIAAWSRGKACRCALLRKGLHVAPGAADSDG